MKQIIETVADAAALFRAALPKEQREERVFVLPLDANGKVLAKPILVSVGHQDGTTAIDVGTIFREALKAGAEEIIVAHNHPTGDPTPSKADVNATCQIREAGELLNVPIIDHIIIEAIAKPRLSEVLQLPLLTLTQFRMVKELLRPVRRFSVLMLRQERVGLQEATLPLSLPFALI